MKVFSLLAMVFAFAMTSSEGAAPLGWFVPQLDGSMEWITGEKWLDIESKADFSGLNYVSKVVFYLYTDSNPESPQILIIGNTTNLQDSYFNSGNPTRFVIHGWQGTADSKVCRQIRDSFLAIGNYNIICVDWSDKSQADYITSVLSVPNVGTQVAGMIDFLHDTVNMAFVDLLVAGHSLGAHVAGYTGKNVNGGRIKQIIGLDPAMPLYSYINANDRLNKTDAIYVETIQTNGGGLGFFGPVGTASFYPNGGSIQPGCIEIGCSHSRSYEYYAEAIIENNFPTGECENFLKVVFRACGDTLSTIRMGASTNYINAEGVYFVPVNSDPPYGTY